MVGEAADAPWFPRVPALRHAGFRRYMLGQGVSLCGFWMQAVAQGWLVWRLSGSAVALGVVAGLGSLPTALFAPLAGVLADRVDRRRAIIVTQSLAMTLAAVLGLLVMTDRATVNVVAVAAACLGLVAALDLPLRQAFLSELVRTEDLPSAIALNASIFNGARVVGPALAGGMVSLVGEGPCFLLNALSYLAVLWALVGLQLPPSAVRRSYHGAVAGLRSGIAYVRADPVLWSLLAALGVVSGLALQSIVVMPAVAEQGFGADARGYGLLLAAFGCGAATSALRLASGRPTANEQRRTLLHGLVQFGVAALVVAGSPAFAPAVLAQGAAGYGMVRYTATTNALLQRLVDDAFRGRVMGLHSMLFIGTGPIGSLVLGAVAGRYGPRAALAVSATTALGVAAWLRRRLAGSRP